MRIFFTPANDPVMPDRVLSPRERQVATLIAEGDTTKIIARKLGVSVKTVEAHRSNLMRKLDLPSLAHVVRYAVLMRFVSP
jgi:DNA-binding NarL/FixJ family response regulator